MELRHIRYFIAAAERGSFRRAAEALNIAESAISRRVRDLEDEVGAALFIRYHGGVHLTHAGERFLMRARRAVSQIRHAAVDAVSVGRGEAGVIRIGIFSSLASGFLADLLQRYAEANPSVRLDFVEGGPVSHISRIQDLHLDVAFLTGNPAADRCDVLPLWDERVLVALPAGDELLQKREVGWCDIKTRHFIVSEADPGPEIQDYIVKHLAELSYRPKVERHSVGRDILMNLVAMGQGITLTSEATGAARFRGVSYRRLANEILPFCAVWSPINDNPALRRLLSLARAMSKARGNAASLHRNLDSMLVNKQVVGRPSTPAASKGVGGQPLSNGCYMRRDAHERRG